MQIPHSLPASQHLKPSPAHALRWNRAGRPGCGSSPPLTAVPVTTVDRCPNGGYGECVGPQDIPFACSPDPGKRWVSLRSQAAVDAGRLPRRVPSAPAAAKSTAVRRHQAGGSRSKIAARPMIATGAGDSCPATAWLGGRPCSSTGGGGHGQLQKEEYERTAAHHRLSAQT